MRVIPLTLKEANAIVEGFHRHHDKVQGHRFSIGAMKNEQLVEVYENIKAWLGRTPTKAETVRP